jgi:1,4-dihydroxy-2-naphthoate octaprenyltransferase
MTDATRRYWKGAWRLADPKITLASMASVSLGLGCAWREGALAWGWFALAVVAVFWLEAAKNASGEIVDWDSGTDQRVAPQDRSPFSGGKRVLVDGLMSRRGVAAFAAVAYALGCGTGVLVAAWHEPRVWGLGVAGVALAFFYHAPPFQLSYRGLGEIAVGAVYGPGICLGTYWVTCGAPSAWPALAALPLGLLIAAFLWINEFPDRAADEASGKRTLVVRLGARAASRVFAVLVAVAYAGLIAAVAVLREPGLCGGFAGLPLSIAAARRLWRHPNISAEIVPAQAWTLFAFSAHAVGAAAGVALFS